MTRAVAWSLLVALFVVISLAAVGAPFVGTASAQAVTIYVSPETGPVNTTVTVVATVTPEGAYTIRWDDKFTGQVLASGQAPMSGAVRTVISVPPAASDKNYHFIFLVDEASGSNDVWPFVITPAISSSAGTGRVGDSVIVTGSGFGTSESVTVTWDGIALANRSADAQGSWSATLTVPPAVRGVHTIGAHGGFTVTSVNQAFTITPTLTISPMSGPSDTVLTAGGTGFGAGETAIEVLWGGTTAKGGIVASAAGSWSTTFVVPSATAGVYAIDAQGSTTNASDVPNRDFTVTRRVAISPAGGYAGTAVRLTGTGFAVNTTVTVTYDLTPVATTPIHVITTAAGNVSATFVVPSGVAGAHAVVVNDGTAMANATFTITSLLDVSPGTGTVGSGATIRGQGFPSFSPVTFAFDGAALATTSPSVTADAGGALSATILIPEAARGTHSIRGTSGATSITASFEVSPKLSVTPDSAGVGDAVTVSGKGFGGGETIVLTLDGVAIVSTPAVVTASATGSFTATLALPQLSGGSHAVKGSDAAASAQASVKVAPKVTFGSGTLKVGDKTSAAGGGFPAGATIAVTADGMMVATKPAPLLADSRGTFTADVTVVAATFGVHTVTFAGGGTTSDTALYVSSSLAVSSDKGSVGSAIAVSGTGYVAGSIVSVTYDGAPLPTTPATLTSSVQGSFQGTITIPKSMPGQHDIVASDAAGHAAQASFTVESVTVESVPPAAPTPSSPSTGSRLGMFGSVTPTLHWSSVSDPSGVTYTLEISRQPNFGSLVTQEKNLAAANYKLTGDEKLGQGYYYWRVKAVDGASNESSWSQTFTFRVGMLPSWMPMWMLIVLVAVCLGIIAGVVYIRAVRFRREY